MAILGTSALRAAWAPACTGPWAKLRLHGLGSITVRATCADAFVALNKCLIAHNYRTRQADTGAFVCRAITGGSGYSLHAYGIAADINWQSNPYGPRLITDMPSAMVRQIKGIRTNSGQQVFGWGGDYRTNKDAMHWEIVTTPGHIRTGINPATVPGGTTNKETFMAGLSEAEQKDLYARIKRLDANALKILSEGRARDKVIAQIKLYSGSAVGWAKAHATQAKVPRAAAVAADPNTPKKK